MVRKKGQKSGASAAPSGHQQGPRLRWTVEKAAVEFELPIASIRARLARHKVKPGPDGCYSTRQMVDAKTGVKELAQIRNIELEGDLKEARIKAAQRLVIPTRLVKRAWEFACAQIRSAIVAQRLPLKTQESIFAEIDKLKPEDYREVGDHDTFREEDEKE